MRKGGEKEEGKRKRVNREVRKGGEKERGERKRGK